MVVLRFPHFVCIHSADQDININILISAMNFPVPSAKCDRLDTMTEMWIRSRKKCRNDEMWILSRAMTPKVCAVIIFVCSGILGDFYVT